MLCGAARYEQIASRGASPLRRVALCPSACRAMREGAMPRRLAELGAFSWAAASDGYGERSRAARLARHSAAVVATRMSQGDEETSDGRGTLRRDMSVWWLTSYMYNALHDSPLFSKL